MYMYVIYSHTLRGGQKFFFAHIIVIVPMFSSIAHKIVPRSRFVHVLDCAQILVIHVLDCDQFRLHPALFPT